MTANLSTFILALLCLNAALAQEPSKEWNGYKKTDFKLGERAALIVEPKTAAEGRPWIWRTEFFGHEPQADIALLGKGYHVVYINMQNLYGAPPAMAIMDSFHAHCTTERKLAQRAVLEGFSRGGLYALNWAALRPEKVAALYLDAPVCDFKSWPAGMGKTGKGSPADWQRCKAAYGLADDEAAKAYKLNPVDHLASIASAKIPVLSVCGDADKVVPYTDNSALVKERLTALGGVMEVIVKPGVDHHPHSLKDPTPIVDFILKHAFK